MVEMKHERERFVMSDRSKYYVVERDTRHRDEYDVVAVTTNREEADRVATTGNAEKTEVREGSRDIKRWGSHLSTKY